MEYSGRQVDVGREGSSYVRLCKEKMKEKGKRKVNEWRREGREGEKKEKKVKCGIFRVRHWSRHWKKAQQLWKVMEGVEREREKGR